MRVTWSPLIARAYGPWGPGSAVHSDTSRHDSKVPADGLMHMEFRDKRPPGGFPYVPGPAKRQPPVVGEFDPRRSYQKARYIWMSFSEAEKQVWKSCIKRSGMSGYDAWMRGALYNFARGLYAPDAPGPSTGCSRGCRRPPKPDPIAPPPPGDVWQPARLDQVWFDPATDCNFGHDEIKNPPPPPWIPPPLGQNCEMCTGYTPAYLIVDFTTLWRGYAPPGTNNEFTPYCEFTEVGRFTVPQFVPEPCYYIGMVGDALAMLDFGWTPHFYFQSPSRGDCSWVDLDSDGRPTDCQESRRLDLLECGLDQGAENCPNYEDCHIFLFPRNPEGDPFP